MAFKNLVHPEVAICETSSIASYASGNGANGTIDTVNQLQGSGCLKLTTTQSYGTIALAKNSSTRIPVTQGLSYAMSCYVKSINLRGTIKGGIYWYNSAGSYLSGSFSSQNQLSTMGNYARIQIVALPPTNAALAVCRPFFENITIGDVFYIDEVQFEQNTQATNWEYPGIDLTNQGIMGQESVNNIRLGTPLLLTSILGQEHINNLTLESILKITATQTQEWVNNLILENTLKTLGINSSEFVPELKLETILQLSETGSAEYVNNLLLQNVLDVTGIPTSEAVNNLILENVLSAFGISSSENVNNLKLINELILQGIESCETFGELIVYIYYELIKAQMTVKRPNITMYAKHPSVRRLS